MFAALIFSLSFASSSAAACGWHVDAAGTGWASDDCGSDAACCTNGFGDVPPMKTACSGGVLGTTPEPAVSGPFGKHKDHWCCTGKGQTKDDNRCDLKSLAELSDDVPKPDTCPPNTIKCTTKTVCEKIPKGKMCNDGAWMDKTCDAVYALLLATDGVSVADRCGKATWTDVSDQMKGSYVSYKVSNKFSKGNSYTPLESKLVCYEEQVDPSGRNGPTEYTGKLVVDTLGMGDRQSDPCNLKTGECDWPTCEKMKMPKSLVPPPGEYMVCYGAGKTYCPGLSYSKDFMAKYYPDNKCPCDNLTPKETGAPSGGGGTGGDDDDGLGIVPIIAIIGVVVVAFALIAKFIIARNKAKAEDGVSSGPFVEFQGEKKPGIFSKIFGGKTTKETVNTSAFISPEAVA